MNAPAWPRGSLRCATSWAWTSLIAPAAATWQPTSTTPCAPWRADTMKIDADTVRELLDYDPETGELTWKPRARRWFKSDRAHKIWNTRYAGTTAGTYVTRPDGYKQHRIKVLGRLYCAGPLVWLYKTGGWPQGQIDHIDRNACNQAWNNLRDVTAAENSRNKSMYARGKGRGYPGVWFNRQRGIWYAYITYSGKQIHLGYHKTLLDA